jgi:hypothetical protein
LFAAVQNVRFWHKADIGISKLLLCKLMPDPYSANRKSLL